MTIVTDPEKRVTDPVLLTNLVRQGIDWQGVEFFQDYASRTLGKEHSPYAKFYRDLNSNKRFMVVSGLPMVNADGIKVQAGWIQSDSEFTSKVNQFTATVKGKTITLTTLNDQPDGRKTGDKLTFRPQLFFNGVEMLTGGSALLPVDPINSNYANNTLEWDYGICKRRLRVIEGSILGSWVFPSNPSSEVRIKYNQIGEFKLKLGQFRINDDEEVITVQNFNQDRDGQLRQYPFVISDSATFYPDKDPESNSVDGATERYNDGGATWADLHDNEGLWADDSNTIASILIQCKNLTNKYTAIERSPILFYTAGLGTGVNVTAATLSLYGQGKNDFNSWKPDINIYASNPDANTVLAATDYNLAKWGSVALCDTNITYNNWKTTDPYWNDFVFNSDGLDAISKTGVTKVGARNGNYDVVNSAPTWYNNTGVSNLVFYTAEQGNGFKPKLVVTYTVVTRILYFENTVLATKVWRKSETAPSAADEVTSVKNGKTNSNNYFAFKPGISDNTVYNPAFIEGDADGAHGWRSENTYNGTFASGNWTIAYKVKNSAKYAHAGQIYARIYRTSNADPTVAQLTKMHSVDGASATISFSATAGEIKTGTFTVNCNQNLTLMNEYLFIIFNWKVITAGGNASAGVKFVVNEGAAEKEDTTIFTAGVVETIITKDFPMQYYQTAGVKELRSKVSGATVSEVAKNFPPILQKSGKAKTLISKWS